MSISVMEKSAEKRRRTWARVDPGIAQLNRRDVAAAILTAAIALGVYIYTLAPSVTMEDSGELITAAAQFGVPHPPGYPLWTMSGWTLTQLLPVGSYAWRINLLSALFGAAASGVLALLAVGSGRWLLASVFAELETGWRDRLTFFGGMTAGLALAFSESMWSQAVIAEVYTLNALFLVSVLYCLFRWSVRPEGVGWLLGAVLAYCLGMTNHHTLMLMLPAFVLLVLLIRPGLLPSFLVGFAGLLLSVLAVFTWFSGHAALQEITQNAAWLVLTGTLVVCFWMVRHFSRRLMLLGGATAAAFFALFSFGMGDWFAVETSSGLWLFVFITLCGALLATSRLHKGLIIGMLVLGWVGLLPYGYLSVASHTNPPMNWGYASERVGFYQLIGREQYSNSLSRMIIKLANMGGLYEATAAQTETPGAKVGIPQAIADAVIQYVRSLDENFTSPLCLLALGVAFALFGLAPPQRNWLIFLVVSFLFLAFAMSVIEPPESLDAAFLWVTRVFKLQSHCIFVLAIAYGIVLLGAFLHGQVKEAPSWSAAALLLFSLLPLSQNAAACSMRGQWFGYLYGYEMLHDLPRNAVVFGGSDAGRFVPVYMIFSESTQPDAYKTVPSFDRRDLFIITQSQLAHALYMQNLRDQYGTPPERREWSTLERWLGRPEEYPPTSLALPTVLDEYEATQEFAVATGQINTGRPLDFSGEERLFALHAILARKIVEANKDEHEFFIEMHFPLDWTWPYLEPAGLLMRIAPEPLETIPPEVVARDRAFWQRLTERLLADPLYAENLPTKRAFSDARAFIAGMYAHRGMQGPAGEAYEQAFALGPENLSSVVFPYIRFLLDIQDFERAEQVLDKAGALDPNSINIQNLRKMMERRRTLVSDTVRREALAREDPENYELQLELLANYAQLRRFGEFDALLEKIIVMPDVPKAEIVPSLQTLAQRGKLELVVRLIQLRLEIDPKDIELLYQLAAVQAQMGEREKALASLRHVLELEPKRLLPVLATDWRFDELREDPEFRLLVPAPEEMPRIPVKEHYPPNTRRVPQ